MLSPGVLRAPAVWLLAECWLQTASEVLSSLTAYAIRAAKGGGSVFQSHCPESDSAFSMCRALCAKRVTHFMSFQRHIHSIKYLSSSSPFSRWGNRGFERWRNSPEICTLV